MKIPIVSIIMPTYNVEKFLPEAVESVLAQTFKEWELLIVDDGSTDNSGYLANVYASKDSRIRVLHKTNGGLSDARNYGLKKASGTYVHFFDSDDTIVPNYYELLVREINDFDFIICGYFRILEDINGRTSDIKTVNCPDIKNITKGVDIKIVLSHFNYAWNKLFKRSFLSKNNLLFETGLSIIEDKDFMSRVLKYEPSFKFVDFSGYNYIIRKRPTLGNSFSDSFVKNHLRGITIEDFIIEYFCHNNPNVELYKNEQAFNTTLWMFHCITNKSIISFHEKKKQISIILKNDFLLKKIGNVPNNSFRVWLFKFLIRMKLETIIVIIYSLMK